MTRSIILWVALALCWVMTVSTADAQSPAAAATQSPSATPTATSTATPTATPSQPHGASPATPADAKKPKRVWTNEDVNGLSGPVSVVGNSKDAGKPALGTKADGQYIANIRKQLEKLRSQLDDAEKQLADLKDFSDGKSPSTSRSYQLNKGYNRVPVDQQITSLQDKKKQLEGKIDALLDEARKKGVQPGDLR